MSSHSMADCTYLVGTGTFVFLDQYIIMPLRYRLLTTMIIDNKVAG